MPEPSKPSRDHAYTSASHLASTVRTYVQEKNRKWAWDGGSIPELKAIWDTVCEALRREQNT